MRRFIISLLLLSLAICSKAEIINVPADYGTIQAAINAAAEHDTVLIAQGTYFENINLTQNIVLTSNYIFDQDTNSIGNTVIDGNAAGSVINIAYGLSNRTIIQFLTIRNGNSTGGGGINNNGNPMIVGNIIENNHVIGGYGGGIKSNSDSTIIYQNIIRNNSAIDTVGNFSSGGGISAWGCIIVENTIYGNNAHSRGGGVYGANYVLRNNLIYNNSCPGYGGGVEVNSGIAEIVNNIIVNNEGEGIYIVAYSSTYSYDVLITNNTIVGNSRAGFASRNAITSILKNNIIWNNIGDQINLITTAIGLFSYNNIQNGPDSSGNINITPIFADTSNFNFELMGDSAGVDLGDPDMAYNDACFPPSQGGEQNDMGALGGPYACVYELPVYEPPVIIPEDNLVAYYPFDGNADDHSSNNNHGTVNGALFTADRFGNDSSAYEFNGVSSYISIPSSSSLESPVDEITLSAWVYVYNFSLVGTYFGPVLMKSNSAANAFQYRMAVTTTGVSIAVNNWDTGASSDSPLTFNSWHFIACTFRDDSVRFYQNGILVDTDYFPNTIISDNRVLEIGRDVPGITEVFYGKMDDIRIFNSAISQSEIDTLFNENDWNLQDPTAPVLVAHYPFDGNAEDQTINNNHGVVNNATLTEDRFNSPNSAYHFDGNDDFIDIGNHPTLKMDDAVTIAAWINIELPLTGGTGFYNVISDHSGSYNNGKIFRFQGSSIEFLLGPEGSMEANYSFAENADGWHHIAATYDGDSIKIFINGNKEAAGLRQGTISVNPNSLLIGKSGFGEHFNGDMDDLRIYKGALSQMEIRNVMGFLPPNGPIAVDDLIYAAPGDSIYIDVMKNDSHFQNSTFYIESVEGENTTGEIIFSAGDSLILFIAPQIQEADSFTYIISDSLYRDSATVMIHIKEGLSSDAWTLALYKFEQDTGSSIEDYSGNNLHALQEGALYESGPYGNSIYLDGSARIDMDIVRQNLQGSLEWSIEYLAKSIDSVEVPALINHSCGNGWALLPQSSTIYYGIKSIAGCSWNAGALIPSAPVLLDTSWHYYALTFKSGDSLKVFKDGQFVDGFAVSGSFSLSQNNELRAYLGYDDYTELYQRGYADELRVSTISREQSSIKNTWTGLKDDIITNLKTEKHFKTDNFTLQQNYPNPFNPTTTIIYHLAEASKVDLKIHDTLGKEIISLVSSKQEIGVHSVVFDASKISSGVYFYNITAVPISGGKTFNQSRKMIILK